MEDKPKYYRGEQMLWFELTRFGKQPSMVFRIVHSGNKEMTGMEVADTNALRLLRDFLSEHLKAVEDFQTSNGAPRLRIVKEDE